MIDDFQRKKTPWKRLPTAPTPTRSPETPPAGNNLATIERSRVAERFSLSSRGRSSTISRRPTMRRLPSAPTPRLGRPRGLLRTPRSPAVPATLAHYLKAWRPSVAARWPVSRPGPSGSRCPRYAGDSPRSPAATQWLGSRRLRNTRSCAVTAAAEASRCGRRSRCSSSSGRRSRWRCGTTSLRPTMRAALPRVREERFGGPR